MQNLDTTPLAGDGGLAALAGALARMGRYVDDLRERVRLLEAVIENFPGGISLYDKDLRMVLCNAQQKALLDYPDALFADGYPTLEALFRFNAQRGEYGPGDVEAHVRRRLALARQRRPHAYERTRPNGTVVEVRGVPLAGGGFVTTYLDVTEQRRNQALIAHMAHHDPLTELPNRLLFADRLKSAVALARRGAAMAVHYLDIDDFKPVNDGLGHKAGDELLVGLARRMRAAVRESDTLARIGGDEFAIVQTGIRAGQDAGVLAGRILERLAAPFRLAGRQVRVGVSIGIALAPRDGLDCDTLLARADAALYAAKGSGRGRFAFFAPQTA